MTKAEFIARLNDLADELAQIGFTDEADRAREIAREVRNVPASARPMPARRTPGSVLHDLPRATGLPERAP